MRRQSTELDGGSPGFPGESARLPALHYFSQPEHLHDFLLWLGTKAHSEQGRQLLLARLIHAPAGSRYRISILALLYLREHWAAFSTWLTKCGIDPVQYRRRLDRSMAPVEIPDLRGG